MSYCRFENTYRDLSDCEDALIELFDGETSLSRDELVYAQRLVAVCGRILATCSSRLSNDKALDAVNDCVANDPDLLETEIAEANEEAKEQGDDE